MKKENKITYSTIISLVLIIGTFSCNKSSDQPIEPQKKLYDTLITSHSSIIDFEANFEGYPVNFENPFLFSYIEDNKRITETAIKDAQNLKDGEYRWEAVGKWSTMKRKYVKELGRYVMTLYITRNYTDNYREIELNGFYIQDVEPEPKPYIIRQKANDKQGGITILSNQ